MDYATHFRLAFIVSFFRCGLIQFGKFVRIDRKMYMYVCACINGSVLYGDIDGKSVSFPKCSFFFSALY